MGIGQRSYKAARFSLSLLSAGIFCILAAGAQARAEAPVPLGGIAVEEPGPVHLSRLDLILTPAIIEARYQFQNMSGEAVEKDVRFSLPPQPVKAAQGQGGALNRNAIGFTLSADKRFPDLEARPNAILKDVDGTVLDVTDDLTRAGIPLTADLAAIGKAAEKLDPLTRKSLVSSGILGREGTEDAGPRWSLARHYVYRQRFPVNDIVKIEHSYRPISAQGYFQVSGLLAEKYCINDESMGMLEGKNTRSLRKRRRPLFAQEIEYDLETANAPIAMFNLVMNPADNEAALFTCMKGVKDNGKGTYAAAYENFTPSGPLKVLVVY
ncbi:conserved protein [Tepidicaulis marinus]|uniref:Conserved protein n=1 Tax=Tepidicaulis marinus TaxID=1333998 RepID=A0A081BA78_9HYPH|nr:DUF4424 family protein [Tepidicaulis marinus]GAK44946.1 conserved protein [Tepidicaulis marinus]